MQLRIALVLSALVACIVFAAGATLILLRDSEVGHVVPRQELVEAAGTFQALSFRVEYDVSHSHSDEVGTLAWYHAPMDKIRLDYTYVDDEGEPRSEIFIKRAGEEYSCNGLAETCARGNELFDNDTLSALELVVFYPLQTASSADTGDSETEGRTYTLRKFEESVRGADLRCFRWSSDGNHQVLCFDEKGIPRRIQAGHDGVADYDDVESTLDAPAAATSVFADDFTPPYPVEQ